MRNFKAVFKMRSLLPPPNPSPHFKKIKCKDSYFHNRITQILLLTEEDIGGSRNKAADRHI